MAPHRQWCYTPEKGTHWYAGPKDKFAPLYQFVRSHAELFDGYESHADLGIVLPHRAFLQNSKKWFDICNEISARGFAYRILLAGDEIVDHPLSARDLAACQNLLVPDQQNPLPADQKLIKERVDQGACYKEMSDALAQATPAVRVETRGQIRALARVKPGSAVVHLLNYQYDAARDDVEALTDVRVAVDLSELGVPGAPSCRWVTPEAEPVILPVSQVKVQIPTLGLWGLLDFKSP